MVLPVVSGQEGRGLGTMGLGEGKGKSGESFSWTVNLVGASHRHRSLEGCWSLFCSILACIM